MSNPNPSPSPATIEAARIAQRASWAKHPMFRRRRTALGQARAIARLLPDDPSVLADFTDAIRLGQLEGRAESAASRAS